MTAERLATKVTPKSVTDTVIIPGRSLHRKLAQIMYEAERIPKNGRAPKEMGGYKFVQVGDAADFIRKALAEKVLTMMPTAVQVVGQQDRPTKSGGSMTTVDLVTDWTITDGESGESIVVQSFGAGADGGDKYSGKASTSAMKYALLTTFLLSTGEDSELGDGQRPPSEPTAARNGPAVREAAPNGGLIGKAEVGKGDADAELRQGPDGMVLCFRLTSKDGGIKVIAQDPLASSLALVKETFLGQRVTAWGRISDETYTANKGKANERVVTYQVLRLTKLQTVDWVLPAENEPWPDVDEPTEAETAPLFDETEQAAIGAAVEKAGTAA